MKIGQRLKEVLPRAYFRILLRLYLRIKFFGFNYYCPFCHANLRSLHPAGFSYPVLKEKQVIAAGFRLNSRCPVCNSFERERMMYDFLKKQDLKNKYWRVLHVAPESNLERVFRSIKTISYDSIDLEPGRADQVMDVQNLKFKDGSFDLVICSHVLEHVPEDIKAMREIYRVLRPGRFAILQVPISPVVERTIEDPKVITPENRAKVFGQSDHVRLYGFDYVDRLISAGFRVETIYYAQKMSRKRACKLSLDHREPLFICWRDV